MKFIIPALLIAAMLATPVGVPAQTDDRPVRVMLVHGVWASSIWEKAVRAELEKALQDVRGYNFEISEQYLGFYSFDNPAPIQRFSAHIEALIREQQIEFVVCVMPAACDFLQPLDIDNAHLLAIGATNATNERLRGRDNASAILSPSPDAIRETIAQVRTLLGTSMRIHFLSGTGINDRRYADLAERIVSDHYPGQDYQMHIAMALDTLHDAAASLEPGKDVAIVLTTEAYGADATSFPGGSLARALAVTKVPVFVFWDAALGTGVVGGSTASAAGYASRAANIISRKLNGGQPPNRIVSNTLTVYDAAQVERFGLDLSRLDQQVKLVNDEPTLWETNPALVLSSIAILILLSLIIVLLSVLLQLNRRSSRQLALREQEARESEAKYRLVAETSADAIWTYESAEQRFSYCSPAIEAISGYTVEEFTALPFSRIVTTRSEKKLAEEIAKTADTTIIELEQNHKNGAVVPVEVSLQVFRDETGEVVRLVGISRDIRERQRRQREAEDIAEQERQRQKMESLGTLAAGIAHDFNNVLGVIVGLVELQKEELKDMPRAQELNEELQEAATRARRLVRRILTFGRPGSDNHMPVNLRRSLRETVRHIESTLPDNVTLDVQLPMQGEGTAVFGDSNLLEQAIINLLTNAIEAVAAKGGKVRAALEAVLIDTTEAADVGVLTPGSYARIRIEDNGSGISEEKMAHIFEPFFTSKDLGSGIGLAIVHSVVTEHTGAIRVNRLPGSGMQFDIFLPLIDAVERISRAGEMAESSSVTELNGSRRLRLLVVDDHGLLLKIVAKMVRNLGHSCITCDDPLKVSAILQENAEHLDIVITDYSMPGMSGTEIIELCRRDYPHLVTFLSTGYATAETEAIARSSGAFGVLPKPMTMVDLRTALDQIVDSKIPHKNARA